MEPHCRGLVPMLNDVYTHVPVLSDADSQHPGPLDVEWENRKTLVYVQKKKSGQPEKISGEEKFRTSSQRLSLPKTPKIEKIFFPLALLNSTPFLARFFFVSR